MKETLRLILVLTVTATLTGALLALANHLTKAPIAEARRAKLLEALNDVLPPHDNEPDREAYIVTNLTDRTAWTCYPARRDGVFAGAAFTASAEGYGGKVTVLIGVAADEKIHAIQVLEQLETPGLGANIVREGFIAQFAGRDGFSPAKLAVCKDGGEIQAITAATISSRAVTEAVAAGLRRYREHRQTGGGAPATATDRPLNKRQPAR